MPAKKTASSEEITIAVIGNDLKHILERLTDLEETIDKKLVTKEEFNPVKNVVYFIVTAFGAAVLGAIFTLILKR